MMRVEKLTGGGGSLIIRGVEVFEEHAGSVFTFTLGGSGFKEAGLLGHSAFDPYCVVSKVLTPSPLPDGRPPHIEIARTERLSKQSDFMFRPITLDVDRAVGGDLNLSLLIEIFDHSAIGKDRLLGSIATDLAGLLAHGMYEGVAVPIGIDAPTPVAATHVLPTLRALKEALGEDVSELSEEEGAARVRPTAELLSEALLYVHTCAWLQRPTLEDFLRGGVRVSFYVAVDFSGSNRDPTAPDSPHFSAPGQPSAYERAIRRAYTVIHELLAKNNAYDMHYQPPPVWLAGFGAKPPAWAGDSPSPVDKKRKDADVHCFPLTLVKDEYVVPGGMDHFAEVYGRCRAELAPREPTLLFPVVREVVGAIQAEAALDLQRHLDEQRRAEEQRRIDEDDDSPASPRDLPSPRASAIAVPGVPPPPQMLRYSVLIVATDGGLVSDLREVEDLVRDIASNIPLSVVILGVQNGDFARHRALELVHAAARPTSPRATTATQPPSVYTPEGAQAALSELPRERSVVHVIGPRELESEQLAAVVRRKLPKQITTYYEFRNTRPRDPPGGALSELLHAATSIPCCWSLF